MDINEIIDFIGAYEEDYDYISLIRDAIYQELKELIPKFDENNITARQKLLILSFIQDFYMNRSLYEDKKSLLRESINSMLTKEMYKL